MSEENVKGMNFFVKVITSIKDFEKYSIFAIERVRKAIGYLALLIIIFSAILSGVFTYKFSNSVDMIMNYLNNDINEITYNNGILSVNFGQEIKHINLGRGLPNIIINTGITKENEYKEAISKYDNGIILLQDRVILKNEMFTNELQYKYTEIGNIYKISEFDKEALLKFIDNSNNIKLYINFFIISTIYMFILYFVSALLDSIMLAIFGYIVSRIIGIRLRFIASFNMGVHSLTLPIILNLGYIMINAFTGLEVKYFSWMYTTISWIYMIIAILMIKADFINKQAELMKIIEEQEKVKQEIEERERKKKEEKDKETKDNKKDEPDENKEEKKREKERKKEEKEDNKSDKEDLNGLAPQG